MTTGRTSLDVPLTRPTLFDRFADRTTRADALEVAIVAYALLYPDAVARLRMRVSPAAAEVLHIIMVSGAGARSALPDTVYFETQFEPAELCRAAVAIAEEAAGLTVQQLAQLGTLSHVADLLASERFHERRSLSARAA